MAATLSKDQLIFDPADLADSDNVGAYVRAGSDGDLITSTLVSGKEGLDVNIIQSQNSGIYAEDSVHASGDLGQFVLAVQTAAQGALANDGDYAPLQVDPSGRLRTITDIDLVGDLVGDDEVDTEDPIKVGTRVAGQTALAAISAAGDKANMISDLYRRVMVNNAPHVGQSLTVTTVGATEVALPASTLAGRTQMIVQNLSNNPIYIGPTGVTTTSGIQIAKGSTMALDIGQPIAVFAIAAGAGNDVRVWQLG